MTITISRDTILVLLARFYTNCSLHVSNFDVAGDNNREIETGMALDIEICRIPNLNSVQFTIKQANSCIYSLQICKNNMTVWRLL